MRQPDMQNSRKTLLLSLLAIPLIAGCAAGSDDKDFWNSPPDSRIDVDVDDTNATIDDSDSWPDSNTGGGTGIEDTSAAELLDEPGDIVEIGEADEIVLLTDDSGDSNREQEFMLLVINTEESDNGFQIDFEVAGSSLDVGSDSGDTAGGSDDTAGGGIDTGDTAAPTSRSSRGRSAAPPATVRAKDEGLTAADIGAATDVFHVRSDYETDSNYDIVTAKLWGLGEYVAIWVDEDVPIDWDYECDGVIDEAGYAETYDFDNCDLETVAGIVDSNIVVNMREFFGEESDVNSDGKLSVLITPVLNYLPLTSSDDDDWTSIVGSYADPEVDLVEYDYSTNPGSDEQELIYVAAPDPEGFYNPSYKTTVEEYTSMALSAQITRSYLKLIAYNYRLLENDAEMEEIWLLEALGAVACDLLGFGALYHQDAWKYLDAPHLWSLTNADGGGFSSDPLGAQYLFARWLVDVWGTDILKELTQTDEVGVDNVEQAIEAIEGSSIDMQRLTTMWQVALLSTGLFDDAGDPLLDTDIWPPFEDASFIEAPTEPPEVPTAGVYYGSNGYQTGFNIRGTNVYVTGGTTDSPEEVSANRVITQGTDFYTTVPGFDSYAYAVGGYGAFVTRITDLDYDETQIKLDGADGAFVGVVIRWYDPESDDYTVETSYSSTEATAFTLPSLPDDGSEIHGLGSIGLSGGTQILDLEDGTSTFAGVEDTDRWLLDLSDASPTETISLAIWLERKFDGTSGGVAPYDPWIAIAVADDVPTPTVDDTNNGDCEDAEYSWGYPSLVLDYIYEQYFLSSASGGLSEDETETETEDEESTSSSSSFDPCGEVTEGLTCVDDQDLDGIADEDEPSPSNFMEQVQIQQCTNTGSYDYSSAWIDQDELDEDEQPYYNTIYNIGGASGLSGEEAVLTANVAGGEQYIVVVSGGGDSGDYELHVKRLN